jgi:hypothetical protein
MNKRTRRWLASGITGLAMALVLALGQVGSTYASDPDDPSEPTPTRPPTLTPTSVDPNAHPGSSGGGGG